MRFILEILTIGLLFNSGFSIAAPADPNEYDDDFQKDLPASNPVIVTSPQEITANNGEEVILPCKIEGNEDDTVVWQRNNVPIFLDNHPMVNALDYYSVDKEHTLRIKHFNESLAGNYTCAIPAVKNVSIAITHRVGAKEPVAIDALSGKKVVESLTELVLTCRARGFPSPNYSWYRKSSENAVEQDLSTNNPTFKISSASSHDSGIYTCKAENGQTSDTKSIQVNVVNGVHPESSKVYPSEEESGTKLCCIFDRTREITWLKEGKLIQINDRYDKKTEKHSNCLIIKKPKEEDLGKYTCQTNKNPTETADIELNGAPSKPVSKKVTTDESKNPTVFWKVMSISPISEYKVFAKKAEELEWKELEHKTLSADDKKDEIMYTFSGLENGQYNVKLEVSNKYGSNESIDIGAVVIDQLRPSVIMSAKMDTDGAASTYRISSLCIIFVILMRLWSC